MKQGDNVLIWGASGGLGSYATQFALAGGANPICVVSSDREGGDLPGDGRRADHRPQRRGLPVLEGRAPPRTPRSGSARQAHPRADRRRGRRHRLRAPGPRDLRRLGVYVDPQGRHDRHLRLDLGLHARVRQPLPVDVPQADHRLALRQLPRGLGGQPADRQGQDPPDPLARSTRWRRPARPPTTSTSNLHQGKVGVLCLAPRGGPGRARPGAARPAPDAINRFRDI